MSNVISNPASVAGPFGAYSHLCEVSPGSRYVQTAGQVGVRADSSLPGEIELQCEVALENVLALLAYAHMEATDITKLSVFLTDPAHIRHFRCARDKLLKDFRPPQTLLIVQALAKAEWLVEIEACAARSS